MLKSLISWYVTLIVKYVEEDVHQNESQRRLIKTEPYLDMKKNLRIKLHFCKIYEY